jgi:hypothetical protein
VLAARARPPSPAVVDRAELVAQVMSGAWHDASEHCHRFVVISRDGAAGAHFVNTLNSLRDISALQAPFGFGLMEVRTVCSAPQD